jgi:hypothetical protein
LVDVFIKIISTFDAYFTYLCRFLGFPGSLKFFISLFAVKNSIILAKHQWLTPVLLGPWEAEIGRTEVQG